MAIDLSSYSSIAAGLFVRIDVASLASPLLFSDWSATVTVEGQSYTGLGKLLNITASGSELRTSSGDVTILISGIPNTSIAEILNNSIKGSKVEIRRVIFDPSTGVSLAISGNPVGRFFGFVNNYSLQEEYDIEGMQASNTIALQCASRIDTLMNKISGRQTNSTSQKKFFPSDLSMDRVANLTNSNFNFGAPV